MKDKSFDPFLYVSLRIWKVWVNGIVAANKFRHIAVKNDAPRGILEGKFDPL